jgi:hypothetical protein
MAEGLLLELKGVGVEDYERVNGHLGIDVQSGEGDWPEGLLFHSAAAKADGLVIYEIWSSRADQESFLHGRLGQALQAGGVAQPERMEWAELASAHDRGL